MIKYIIFLFLFFPTLAFADTNDGQQLPIFLCLKECGDTRTESLKEFGGRQYKLIHFGTSECAKSCFNDYPSYNCGFSEDGKVSSCRPE